VILIRVPTKPRTRPGAPEKALLTLIDDKRRGLGLTHHALAERTGISRPMVTKMLAGDKPTTVSELLALCEAVGSSLSEISAQVDV
jgi:predicted transcriptional regulator